MGWDKLSSVVTKTSGFTLSKAIACAVQFDDQHCGIYAGDWDSYKDFSEVFDPLIQEYHGISADAVHTSDMDVTKIKGNIDPTAPVKSVRIRVGRSIDGFGLSPGITKEQRLDVENLMKKAFANLREIWLEPTIPLPEWKKLFDSNWSMTTSYLCRETRTLPLLVWNEIGLKGVEYSTTRTKLS